MQNTMPSNKNIFAIGMLLNAVFVVIELFFGYRANSIALIADAVHKASDVVGLGLVWLGYFIAERKATHRFTFGFKNVTIIAAFCNSFILVFAIGNLLWQSAQRLYAPEPVVSSIVIFVALIGVAINGSTALLFFKDKNRDLNILSAFLNMALDALISLSIVLGGVFIWWKNWFWLDPILGIIIALTIFYSIWTLFKESLHLVLRAVPRDINIQDVMHDLNNFKDINAYHNLHIWALSTTETAMTVHVTTSTQNFNHDIVAQLAQLMRDKYNIQQATIQIEIDDVTIC